MAISVACTCGKLFQAPESFAGKHVKCPICGAAFRVPSTNEPAPSDARKPPQQVNQSAIPPARPQPPPLTPPQCNTSPSAGVDIYRKRFFFAVVATAASVMGGIVIAVPLLLHFRSPAGRDVRATSTPAQPSDEHLVGGEKRQAVLIPPSPQDELAKTIEAARHFIDAGQPDDARRLLNKAEKNPVASDSDKDLISALLAKINVGGNPAPQNGGANKEAFNSTALSSNVIPAVAGKDRVVSEESQNAASSGNSTSLGDSVRSEATSARDDLPALIERVQPSIVKITTNEALGSGFVVDDGLVVTNRHVMEGARSATVHFKDGRTHKVEGIVFDGGKLDLCILRCQGLGSDVAALELATDTLRQGESLFTFGAPKGLDFSVSEGIVSANRWIDDVAYVQTTAPISAGNSGGPLLRVKDGSVVGINTWTRIDGQNLNFAIAVSHLREALTKLESQPAPLNLAADSYHSALTDEAKAPSFSEQLKAVWEEKVAKKRQSLEPTLDRLRASMKSAASPGAKSAFTVQLAQMECEYESAGRTVVLEAPKISLSDIGKLNIGKYGFVQDRMPVLQILNEWNCLLYVNGVVFLLEDFSTAGITTDTILTAKNGPVVYVSGTYRYTTKLGIEKQVLRLRPAWDLEKMSEQIISEQERISRECSAKRDATIQAVLTRNWTSASFNGEAQFKTVFGIGGELFVVLTKEGGAETRVPLTEFSEEDQEWVSEYRAHSKR